VATSELFGPADGSPAAMAATDDAAWLTAMLDVERALALASARAGLVSSQQALAVAAACRPEDMDLASLAAGTSADATPVPALVSRLRDLVPPEARAAVHVAATSQDVLDTALVLVLRRALDGAAQDAAGVAALLAGLARQHRDSAMAGRTLLQQAVPTTFGAACASRLVAVDDARTALAVAVEALPAQLGGAAGTLASAGDAGPGLVALFAQQLDLAEPVTPWHTARGPLARAACAAGVLAGELAALAQDVVLLSATEIGEVAVASPGGSSAMPHKRNPAPAVLALACAHRVPGLVATVLAAMPQGLQRAAGPWQAEWGAHTDLARLVAGTAHHTRSALDGLQVDTEAMARHVAALLTRTAQEPGTGSATAFVDRALATHDAREQLHQVPR
jgi:3-carboxy-cis,cis-muconate cycloisomerase